MSDLIAFNNEEDFRRVMRAVQFFERQRYGNSANKPSPTIDGIYAKVTELIESEIDEEAVYREAKGVQVEFDAETGEFIDIDNDPYVFDTDLLDSSGATLFNTTNITSQTDMAEDQVYLLQYSPHIRETSDWFVVQTGGAGARRWAVITSLVSATQVKASIYEYPNGPLIETGKTVNIYNAVDSSIQVDDAGYVDYVEALDVYYIQAFSYV